LVLPFLLLAYFMDFLVLWKGVADLALSELFKPFALVLDPLDYVIVMLWGPTRAWFFVREELL
jgi:hypothetical protein